MIELSANVTYQIDMREIDPRVSQAVARYDEETKGTTRYDLAKRDTILQRCMEGLPEDVRKQIVDHIITRQRFD